MKVERVIAYTPSNCALFTCGRCLVRLTFDTKVHDVISADGTVVDYDIPSPQSHSIPLLHFKPLLTVTSTVSTGPRF